MTIAQSAPADIRKPVTKPVLSAGVLIAILLVAANLRATLTGVGTLLGGDRRGQCPAPAVIHTHVPGPQVHTVSALYVTAMGLVAALSSGISVPLAKVLPGTWHSALAWAVVIALVALAVWLPRLREARQDDGGRSRGTHARTPWRSWLA